MRKLFVFLGMAVLLGGQSISTAGDGPVELIQQALAKDGIKDSESLGAFTLSRVGTAALNKVARDIRANSEPHPVAAIH